MFSKAVTESLASGSMIRAMFEQGNILKAKYGAENVYDFALGNPDPEPDKDIIDDIRLLADEPNIRALGDGWVGDEALAIALYCCLRYPDDFSKAITTAVNHKGDSDSTGAIAGNILGAKLGYSAIDEKWLNDLELADVILEVADDLCHGCQMSEYSPYRDPAWEAKYIYHMRYLPGELE
jgi:ADP-ribosylglycohydrolase